MLKLVRERLTINSRLLIVTPNPEIVLKASKDSRLTTIINSAEVIISDGVGVVAASKFLSLPNPKNKVARFPLLIAQGVAIGLSVILNISWFTNEMKVVKGREMFIDLVKLADRNKWRVYLLGGKEDEACRSAEKLSKFYAKVKIRHSKGPVLDQNAKPVSAVEKARDKKVLAEIRKYKPHLLFVAFGAPKQEKWLACNLPNLPVGAGMTVGGAFNFVSGNSKLPPHFLEKLGLEWLWRLFTEPWRYKRILNATIVFPFKVLLEKMSL